MDAMRCQYASKPCDQSRSFKENGELHRLCMYHRTRANDAQRRWHSRQRTSVLASDSDATSSSATSTRSSSSSASDDHVSERTKRRRRAAQAARNASPLGDGARVRRVRRRPTVNAVKTTATMAMPSSPPAVDSASFTSLLGASPFFAKTEIAFPTFSSDDQTTGHERLSTEDIALLDELMMCMDETKPMDSAIMVDAFVGNGPVNLDWPLVPGAVVFPEATTFFV